MALSEDQTLLLGLYREYLREQGLCVCERMARPDGSLAHGPVLGLRGKEMIGNFAHWIEARDAEQQVGQEEQERG